MFLGKLSVIMPAYNEAQYIEANVRETISTLSAFGYEFEIIVVDDGSPDNTHLAALRARLQHPDVVRVVRYDHNQGKGNALTCGVSYATGDYIVFLDADMDLHPEQLPLFFEILSTTGVDVVIGSKRHPLSNVNYPTLRRIYSTFYYALVRLLFGLPVRDTQTGIKVFRAACLRKVLPRVLVKRFAFDIELLTNIHHAGFKIGEAPVTLRFQREFGRISYVDVFNIFVDTLAIFYRMKILRYYDRRLPEVELVELGREVLLRELRVENLERPNVAVLPGRN